LRTATNQAASPKLERKTIGQCGTHRHIQNKHAVLILLGSINNFPFDAGEFTAHTRRVMAAAKTEKANAIRNRNLLLSPVIGCFFQLRSNSYETIAILFHLKQV
jgi:hypothetical protein